MNKRRFCWWFCFLSICCLFTVYIVNPYIRTDIFRRLCKGNWFLLCDSDTLYSMGYYGIKKYRIDGNDKLFLLDENAEYAGNRMIYRGGCIYGDYLFITTRSWLPGSKGNEDKQGDLLILRKSDLKVVKAIRSDIKLIEAHTERTNLIVSGIGGFNIFDISYPNKPRLIYTYRRKDSREYQGFDIMQHDCCVYIAFALFGQGLELWDITNPQLPQLIVDERIPISGQSMDLICIYPYIYATIGPEREEKGRENDNRGLIVYDISKEEQIRKNVVLIPKKDFYKHETGDCQPTYICHYRNRIFLNFAEKGVAIFNIKDAFNPQYEGLIDIGKQSLIQPIAISEKGVIFAGSYYWPNVYSAKSD